jgi:hypothetical protein
MEPNSNILCEESAMVGRAIKTETDKVKKVCEVCVTVIGRAVL